MSPSTRLPSVHALLLSAVAGVFAVAIGLAVGDPGSGMLRPVATIVGLMVVSLVIVHPMTGFLALVFSLFFLLVVPIAGTQRNVNIFDLVLVPLLLATTFGGAKHAAEADDDLCVGEAHDTLRVAARRFATSAVLYFGLAALSLVPMAVRIGPGEAIASGLALARAVQGALIFPLALWWLRDERRVTVSLRTICAAAIALAVVNLVWVFAFRLPRAGMVWWVTESRDAIGSPNEAAVALLLLWALLHARWAVRPSPRAGLLMGLVVVMLLLTQSRSGLLAFGVFLLLTVKHVRWRRVLGSLLALALALPLAPPSFWTRMSRTLTFQEGSPEVFSFMIRLYSYETAWRAFLDHPLFGVGYFGFRFVSVKYNEFHFLNLVAENFLLETLAGLGLVGLVAVGYVFVRLWALGRTIQRITAPKTLGHELARLNAPLLVALLVTNLTGSTVVGMVGVGQVALWAALLVRSGHLAMSHQEEA
jgi:O-antigen ligase